MRDYKLDVANAIAQKVEELELEGILESIEVPPNKEMGDYAFPCFKLAKIFRKAPNMIAQEISEKVENGEYLERAEPAGGYVNFFVNKSSMAKSVVDEVISKGADYGKSDFGKGKKVIVEFSSPNIAKPFHIGHIRSTVIGNSIHKIYDAMGYDTVTVNHLGDYGTQFGKLIVAIKKWGDEKVIQENPIKELLKIYIKFHDEAEKEPALEDEARMWFKKLEDGDEEAQRLWKWIRDVSLIEFGRVYDMLGIKFDSYAGESFYSDKMDKIVGIMEDKSILKKSEGADIVDLEEHSMPPALIRKSDGSTLYITRDIAAAVYRKEHYDFFKNIYVVASQQNLHFKQWFKVLELMGFDWANECEHVPFGLVSLEEGTLATRKGRVVFLEDVLKKAVEKTTDIIKEKNPNLENIDQVARQVGIGAVIFQELYNNRIKDYTFSFDRTLSFEGETGPYVQYTHARACSVLRKAGEYDKDSIDYSVLTAADEFDLVKELEKMPKAVADACAKNEPHVVSRYVMDVAKAFNKFYHNNQIIIDDETLKNARLALVDATRQTIKNSLTLLGVESPERM
ncbi:arginyl-tRNA synthetase [Peptoclostridium litorale DSM 5388]|uniref:Arginine--tRNA ligase n=1 Tax=Peptoclostridium litorale DSM 5388 TaxID=1121324 RepID=A0A069RIM4_PEPLI|nr:arginine--tRNA ligase [Peptoclostridium litorale]KDR96010.1 arginine--tRNA ligase ArgS [Peptoclostridium litorale DSM 5388]SIO06715.1 arginyl-tRNA synthetase [Peptoclostridium litorale DSM 5388]